MKTLKIDFRKMNNERYNQIIDEAWKKYLDETRFTSNPEWLEPVEVVNVKTLEKNWGARQYYRDDFINKCKTDAKFSERWGLKIEERELTWKERSNLQTEDQRKGRVPDKNGRMQGEFGNLSPFTEKMIHYWCDQFNIPTKLLTVTYNNKTIEIYE